MTRLAEALTACVPGEVWKGRRPISRPPPCVADPRFPRAVPFGSFADRHHWLVAFRACIGERPVPNGHSFRFELLRSMCMRLNPTGRRRGSSAWPVAMQSPDFESGGDLRSRPGLMPRIRECALVTLTWTGLHPVDAAGLRHRLSHSATRQLLVKKHIAIFSSNRRRIHRSFHGTPIAAPRCGFALTGVSFPFRRTRRAGPAGAGIARGVPRAVRRPWGASLQAPQGQPRSPISLGDGVRARPPARRELQCPARALRSSGCS